MCYTEMHILTINMVRTGQNIMNLRQERGLSVRRHSGSVRICDTTGHIQMAVRFGIA